MSNEKKKHRTKQTALPSSPTAGWERRGITGVEKISALNSAAGREWRENDAPERVTGSPCGASRVHLYSIDSIGWAAGIVATGRGEEVRGGGHGQLTARFRREPGLHGTLATGRRGIIAHLLRIEHAIYLSRHERSVSEIGFGALFRPPARG